jgi:hypothetical protein
MKRVKPEPRAEENERRDRIRRDVWRRVDRPGGRPWILVTGTFGQSRKCERCGAELVNAWSEERIDFELLHSLC